MFNITREELAETVAELGMLSDIEGFVFNIYSDESVLCAYGYINADDEVTTMTYFANGDWHDGTPDDAIEFLSLVKREAELAERIAETELELSLI